MLFMNNNPLAPLYNDAKHTISITSLACCIYVLIQLCASFLISFAIGTGFGLLTQFSYTMYSVMNLLNALVLLLVTPLSGGLAAWFACDSLKISVKEDWSKKISFRDVFFGLCVLLFFSFVISLFFSLFNFLLPTQIVQPDFGYSSDFASNALLFLAIVIVGPFVEEIFFRGTILKATAKYGMLFSIVFSSVCFGLLHMNIAQGIPAFFMGLVLGTYYTKTKNLAVPYLIHALNNFIAFTGMNDLGMIFSSLLIPILAFIGLVYLIRHIKDIREEVEEAKGDPHFATLTCSNPWMIVLFVIFLISSLMSLAVL